MLKKAIVIALSTFALVGCSSEVDDEKEKVEQGTVEPGNNEQVEEAAFQFPLTGERTKQEPEVRSVAVMVNNHPKARPQSGLSQADIVYEVLAEGEITRFLAIFQSEKPEKIGPVRSARDYYIDLAKGYDSLYIAHGYSPKAREMLRGGSIDNLNGIEYDGSLFKRASDRVAPHNSYISYTDIVRGAEDKEFEMSTPPENLSFLEKEEKITGEMVESVTVSYFDNPLFEVVYQYNEEKGKYERYSNGEQTIDYETGEPVLLENIFIAETAHKVVDSAGRRNIDIQSGGEAYLLQEGKMQQVEWENEGGKILPYKDGEQVPFVKGSTWINIIPDNPGLDGSVSY
ncbi:DUF3048 domain-containing protein [Bacillus seohaeanensis]|jgi:hypothetical protein|uniref:DUF3048 domain-containing protein n=1 Tax=Bacillus seohaeanensis TaxID=284580 RepID=A0ABW5RXF4_9BACI